MDVISVVRRMMVVVRDVIIMGYVSDFGVGIGVGIVIS